MGKIALLVLLLASLSVWESESIVSAQTCPPPTGMVRQYAYVERIEDLPIVQAEAVMEVAAPWLNDCSGIGKPDMWASQVMWLWDPSASPPRFAEIGWRRMCSAGGSGAEMRPYYSSGVLTGQEQGAGSPRWFVHNIGQGLQPVTVNPGDRVGVKISLRGGHPESPQYNIWAFQAVVAGTPHETTESIPAAFEPERIRVGGENLYDLHDMGVAGILETAYKMSNGTQFFLHDRSVQKFEDRPRYRIVKGTGGFGGSNYFQVHSNIHVNDPSPTALPPGAEMCD